MFGLISNQEKVMGNTTEHHYVRREWLMWQTLVITNAREAPQTHRGHRLCCDHTHTPPAMAT